jgi:DNA-directed RNA polymerase specialized sigma24 family protein
MTGAAVQRGPERDPAAFAALWRVEEARLRSFCRYKCDGYLSDPDEVFAATAMRAWRSFSSLRDKSRFGAWLRQIAAREAGHLARRRRNSLLTETAAQSDPSLSASDPATDTEPPLEITDTVLVARSKGYLSAPEAAILAARLQSQESTDWESVSVETGLSREACAVHWVRAIPKLRLFLMVTHSRLVGGRQGLLEAFEKARRAVRGPLLPLEIEAFQHEVIERRTPRRREGWTEALRSAAAKVVRHLAIAELLAAPSLDLHARAQEPAHDHADKT